MAIVSTGVAPLPAPVKRVAAKRDPSPAVVELTDALNRLPAGDQYVDFDGKSSKGVALVAGKIASANGFAIRTQPVSETVCRIWKIALTGDEVAARADRKARAKQAKAEREAKNLADLKAE